ncbi:MAG: hypothetical protein ACHQWU_04710 [Gemmatimonadales bacterium]
MLNRNTFMLVAGAALVTASVASGQDSTRTRPRSDRRIPVQKEASGEVAPRVDTVTVYKTDTLQLQGRVDTVTTTNTVTHYDTVTQTIMVPPRLIGGMYFGLGGGTNLPYGGLRSVNNPAATGQLQLGWQGINSLLGLRADGEYNQFSHASNFAVVDGRFVPKPDVWNVNADLRLNLPIFNHFLGSASRFVPYLLGGGSFVAYKNLRIQQQDPAGTEIDLTSPDPTILDGSYHHNWGWNAGGGLGVHFGKKEVFVESRLIQFNRGVDNGVNVKTARQIPIVFGVNFY